MWSVITKLPTYSMVITIYSMVITISKIPNQYSGATECSRSVSGADFTTLSQTY